MRNVRAVDLEEYWRALAYPDESPEGPAAPPIDASQYPAWKAHYDMWFQENARIEAAAWDRVCDLALEGRIQIYAFRWRKNRNSLTWYAPETDTVRELIPQHFFWEPTKLGPGNPVVIYYADKRKGNVFNAPWRWPIVVETSTDQLTEAPRTEGPPVSKRGGVPKADWEEYRRVFASLIETRGYPSQTNEKGWQRTADVQRWLQEQIEVDKLEPVGVATLYRHAAELMAEFCPEEPTHP